MNVLIKHSICVPNKVYYIPYFEIFSSRFIFASFGTLTKNGALSMVDIFSIGWLKRYSISVKETVIS